MFLHYCNSKVQKLMVSLISKKYRYILKSQKITFSAGFVVYPMCVPRMVVFSRRRVFFLFWLLCFVLKAREMCGCRRDSNPGQVIGGKRSSNLSGTRPEVGFWALVTPRFYVRIGHVTVRFDSATSLFIYIQMAANLKK